MHPSSDRGQICQSLETSIIEKNQSSPFGLQTTMSATSRVILITGANGGLGQAIARAFLSEAPGNFVWLGVRSARDRAESLAAEFTDRCQAVQLDVTRRESWEAAIAAILARHKRLDVLVNNAGKHADALLATMPQS